jgi:protein arginine kinase activator
MKCDKCNNAATVHLIEIVDGEKIEKHLCEEHAGEAGVSANASVTPINSLLKNFVLKHSGAAETEEAAEQSCEDCGLVYSQFRKKGLLGCPSCYEAFEEALEPLLERAHGGESQHLGKVPARAGDDQARQQRLLQLRRELDRSVRAEQYETAARIRDQVRQLESDQS